MNKLILIMVDGISSEHFQRIRHQLPHLDQLAKQGTYIKALTPETCGTSFPGRTSMIVGRPASEHGIYGNRIWDGEVFRWSNPYDVRTETLASLTKNAGGDVVNMGFGMVRPEDCNLYVSPWWVEHVGSNTADGSPHPANQNWSMRSRNLDPQQRLAALGLDANNIVNPCTNNSQVLSLGILADYQLLEMAAHVIAANPPDLLMLEVAITDYFLHEYGAANPITEMSLRTADAQIGTLLERLRQSGQLDQYNFAIMSDHGHHLMRDCIHCDVLLPEGCRWSSEGSMLFVAPRSSEERETVTQILLEQGMEVWSEPLLPDALKNEILVFSCPEGLYISFEKDSQNTGEVNGISHYQSNHGMRPGTKEDYRFCIFAGPNVPQQQIEFAQAIQVAPTMAAIMGVATPWSAQSLI
ncbi:MAG: alkaline phosphatase family protein [Oceanospirillaceae bacterium]|nr:alkaline phosphatase family protein [Oceanospirillaceae bacterium]